MEQTDQWVIELRNRRLQRMHELLNGSYYNMENGLPLTEEDANNRASESLNSIVSENEWLGNNNNVLFTEEEIELATSGLDDSSLEDKLRAQVELGDIKTFEDLHLLRQYMLGNNVSEIMISVKTVFDENNDIIVESL